MRRRVQTAAAIAVHLLEGVALFIQRAQCAAICAKRSFQGVSFRPNLPNTTVVLKRDIGKHRLVPAEQPFAADGGMGIHHAGVRDRLLARRFASSWKPCPVCCTWNMVTVGSSTCKE